MQSIKTPYYPNKQLFMKVTPFGAIVVFPESDIYDKPIPGKVIMKIDAVKYLDEIWGDACVRNRSYAYRIISGDCSDTLFRDTIVSMYKRFQGFASYVDTQWKFGDRTQTEMTRIIKPARDHVDSSISGIKERIEQSGGKFLLCTHDYVYAAYSHDSLPDIKHAEVIRC